MTQRELKTVWICETCGRRRFRGDMTEFGYERYYRCERHPHGKSLALEIVDFRRRRADERSFRKRGVSSSTYLRMVDAHEADRADGIRMGGDGRYYDREGNLVPPEKVLEAVGTREQTGEAENHTEAPSDEAEPPKGSVYLIHFARPFHHARHYLGYTENLEERMQRHRNGNGSTLMHAVTRAGIPWEVVRTWEGVDRNFERKLKNRKNAWKLCPVCRAKRLGTQSPSPRSLQPQETTDQQAPAPGEEAAA